MGQLDFQCSSLFSGDCSLYQRDLNNMGSKTETNTISIHQFP